VPRSIEVLVPPEDLPVLQHISSRSKPLCRGTRSGRRGPKSDVGRIEHLVSWLVSASIDEPDRRPYWSHGARSHGGRKACDRLRRRDEYCRGFGKVSFHQRKPGYDPLSVARHYDPSKLVANGQRSRAYVERHYSISALATRLRHRYHDTAEAEVPFAALVRTNDAAQGPAR